MSIAVQIFLGVVGIMLTYFLVKYTGKLAEYTKGVAQCNEKLSEETQRLRKITETSWLVKELADYLFDKYYKLIDEWPGSSWPDVFTEKWQFPPIEKEKPRVFRMYCRQICLKTLFPQTEITAKKLLMRFEEIGFKFKERTK